MKLSECVELRNLCKNFLEATMDELHGTAVEEPMVAGMVERMFEVCGRLILSDATMLGGDYESRFFGMMKMLGLQIVKTPE